MLFKRASVLIISAGLIQNEEAEVVELVRQLTESYVSRPNTIILTTIPMSGK
jgi:vacuolar protein sorting-associated protein 1